MKLIPFLLAATSLAWSAPTLAEEMEILPIGLPIAQVHVDGQGPFRFIIDTAATSTTVLPAFEARMPNLKSEGEQQLNGAGGEMRIDRVRLDRLETAGREFDRLSAFRLPPSPIDELGVDGVLGADVLAGHVLEIDVPRRFWALHPAGWEPGSAAPVARIPFTLDDGLAPRFAVLVDGTSIDAILDTGARGTILNWAAAEAIGIAQDDPALIRKGEVRGVTAHTVRNASYRFDRLEIGAVTVDDPELHIADLPIFQVLGAADSPAMILGIDQLSRHRIIVDYAAGVLLFF